MEFSAGMLTFAVLFIAFGEPLPLRKSNSKMNPVNLTFFLFQGHLWCLQNVGLFRCCRLALRNFPALTFNKNQRQREVMRL